ncbi:MAG: VCBS repeat-containing protein, partial [Acidimicrobiia bacterium]|nr:VCBS repeat-containing protein [Acidimicrobiia bacterium]
VLLGLEATVTGGPETLLCEPLFNPGVELSNTTVLGTWPGPFGVAISAPWELTPHFVQTETDDGTYSAFAKPLLAARGLNVANPVIKQIVRADLDGDGVNEVVTVTEDIADPSLFAQEGDYSLVFLRRVVEGEVQTAILGESIVDEVVEGETPFVLSFDVAAVADLSGDGKMEIVVNSKYYEGLGFGVWEYVNDDLGPVLQIQSGCGA